MAKPAGKAKIFLRSLSSSPSFFSTATRYHPLIRTNHTSTWWNRRVTSGSGRGAGIFWRTCCCGLAVISGGGLFGGLVQNYWKESHLQHAKLPSHHLYTHIQSPIKKWKDVEVTSISLQGLSSNLLKIFSLTPVHCSSCTNSTKETLCNCSICTRPSPPLCPPPCPPSKGEDVICKDCPPPCLPPPPKCGFDDPPPANCCPPPPCPSKASCQSQKCPPPKRSSNSTCSQCSSGEVDVEALSSQLGGLRQVDWVTDSDLTHCFLIKQASQVTVDSVTRIITETATAYEDYHCEYRRVIEMMMDSLEESRTACGQELEVLECKLVLARSKVDEMKKRIQELDIFLASVEKLGNSAAETAFMANAEYASLAMLERLHSLGLEVKRLRDETKERERDMLELQALIIVESGKSLK